MQKRQLTKEDLDKVRNIDGFPIGSDEDIIALSDPPYYTACPNPFIEDFIKENGTPYDEATDDYHCEPYAADVSEGKNDPIYNAHSYHTKVPYKAIMKYILHYTKPGDIVFDGFCGSGMTGVAAQMCGNKEANSLFKDNKINQNKGCRKAILNDLAVAATFISNNYNDKFVLEELKKTAKEIIDLCKNKFGWFYETSLPKEIQKNYLNIDKHSEKAIIQNTIWSSVFICSECGMDFVFYDYGVDSNGKVLQNFNCPHCNALLTKSKIERKEEIIFDELLNKNIKRAVKTPVFKLIKYHGKTYREELNDLDYDVINKIDNISLLSENTPTQKMLFKDGRWGDIYRSGYHIGFTHAHHFYTKRNLIVLNEFYKNIYNISNPKIRKILMFALTGCMQRLNRTNKWLPSLNMAPGPITGMLYIPSLYPELNVFNGFENKINDIIKFCETANNKNNDIIITTQSSGNLINILPNSIDYIFTDPPFGSNIMYSESNFLWEVWLKVFTQNKQEAIVNDSQKKGLHEYQELMTKCFCELYRVLKPNRWMTVEFHNSKNAVWNAIQEAILRAGFVIADVRTLDKQQGSFKQVTTTSAVKQDLVISAYKPKESLKRKMLSEAGSEETAWAFVRQHLENLPVVVVKNYKIEVIAERQAYLLFDRMVAYHIMQGLPVPIDAGDFYKGLKTRKELLERDGMYFLSSQVNEYDAVRVKTDLENIDFSLFVTNEKSAIGWIYRQLSEKDGNEPQTYAELQPKFMQELKAVDKYEAIPELSVLLQDNFLKDEETGKWRIPDPTKEADVKKLREKNLLKEFETYRASKGKLKSFRSEAIRVGFAHLWKEKNFNAIVEMGKRLPESIIQEDSTLLMYYDNSLNKVENILF